MKIILTALLLIVATAQASPLSIEQNPFQYSHEYTDAESGLQYLSARYYDPKLTRFVSRDSLPLINRYVYADGNPVMNIDPSGHFFILFITNFFHSIHHFFSALPTLGYALTATTIIASSLITGAPFPYNELIGEEKAIMGVLSFFSISTAYFADRFNQENQSEASTAFSVMTFALIAGTILYPVISFDRIQNMGEFMGFIAPSMT